MKSDQTIDTSRICCLAMKTFTIDSIAHLDFKLLFRLQSRDIRQVSIDLTECLVDMFSCQGHGM